jgi:hypothetical protein
MSVIDLSYNFASLSLHDLLDARDFYHYHLLSKANVVGTAVGFYLIRKDEEWPQRKGEGRSPVNKKSYPRTLVNSEVRDYSWPCILAFVRSWEPEESFGAGARYNPAQIVPKTLYLPDGRAVPVCVVEAHEVPNDTTDPLPTVGRPSFKLGGGLPIIVNVQGEEKFATAGCLVTDGHLTYALTARHACGEPGTIVSSLLREGQVQVGTSSPLQRTRVPFTEVYPDFPGRRLYSSLDIGLVRVDNIDDWTSNTYGLPPVGPLADVHEGNLSLRLIDQPVVGYGAASGLISGRIKALFYRHRSVGGYDYVGDFLISPGEGPATRHGDSGMVWHLDVTEHAVGSAPKPFSDHDLRPLAVEWGGQVFDDGGQRSTFAVATSLSNVCKLLDVELVTDLSRGVSGYWGRTGHYSIAALAIQLVGDARLKSFLRRNAEIISFDLEKIAEKTFDKSVGQMSGADEFVPLADVPDEIWKKLDHGKQARTGGRDISGGKTGSDGPEHPTHYADIDAKFGPHGETWRQLCLKDDGNITVAAWRKYYATMGDKAKTEGDTEAAKQYHTLFKQGLLPFRLWQFFDAMSEFANKADTVGFLTAAGVSAHYMGDASQPLHGSIYADGDRSRNVEREHPASGKTETVAYAKGVHSAYETAMISAKAPDLLKRIQAKLPAGGHGIPLCASGKEVATATLELMDKAAAALKPMDILDSYEKAGASTRKATLEAMWKDLGNETAEVMALGARYLAMLWESAWVHGNGPAIAPAKLKELDTDEVRGRYIDKGFVPSLALDKIDTVLK